LKNLMLSESNDYSFLCAIRRSIIWWDTRDCYPYSR